MSNNEPSGATQETPTGGGADDQAEEIEAEIVEDADEDVEAEVAPTPQAAPPPPPSRLPGVPRPPVPTRPAPPPIARPPSPPLAPVPAEAAAPARVPAASAPPAAPPPPSLDETIAAAVARASASERGLADLYEGEVTALGAQSRQRQALYTHEIGELSAARGDEGAAIKAWARALQADPSLRPNLWAIRRAFERRAMWPNVLKLLDAELRFAKLPEERAELHIERGAILEDRVGDPAGAVQAYEAALKEDPSALRAYMALERRLLEEPGDPERLRRVLGGLAAATRDPARRAALLIDLSRIESEAGGEGLERARAALAEALSVELGDETTGRAYARSGSPASLSELERLAVRADRADWREQALQARLALLQLDSISRPPASEAEAERIARGVALRLHLASVAEARDDGAVALEHLEAAAALAADDPAAAPVVEIELAEAARGADRAALAGRLSMSAAALAPPALKGALLLEAIDAFERAGLADELKAVRAEAEAAGLGEVLALRLRRAAERGGDDEALAQSYTQAAERALAEGDVQAGGAALARAAAILGERLGRHDEAIACAERALSVLPPGELAEEHADALEWRLLRLRRFDACAQLVQRRIAATPPGSARLRLVARHAGLLADRVGDAGQAASQLREVVDAQPDGLALRYELAGLYRLAGAHRESAEQLAEIVRRTQSTARKAELEIERGALLAWHAGDATAGESALREAIRLAPTDGRASAALEELFERQRGAVPDTGSQDTTPARVEALVTALRAEIDANLNPDRATSLLSRLAELHERERQDHRAAAQVYTEFLARAADPDEQMTALRGLQRAHAALGDHAAFVDALERELELLPDERARIAQRARLAWEHERRGRVDAGADAHALVLDHVEVAPSIAAAAHLGRLQAAYRSNDVTEIAAELGALVPFVDAELTSARVAVDLEHAAALAEQGEAEGAAVVAARAHAHQPESRVAQLALLTTAGRREDVAGVGAALAAIGQGTTAPAARASLLRRSALCAVVSGEVEPARERARAAAEAQPEDATRVVLAEVQDDVAVLEARAELAEGPARVAWLVSLGASQAERGQLAAASASLGAALALAPTSLLALELDRRVRRAAGDRRGFARRTLALGELLAEAERAARMLVEAGEAFESVGEPRAAAYAYREALQRAPFDGEIFARARALLLVDATAPGDEAEPRRSWAKAALLELLDHRLAHASDLPERVAVLLDRAELYGGAGDRVAAERDLRALLELDPDESRGVWALLRLCADDPQRLDEVRVLAERLGALRIEDVLRRDMYLTVADAEQRADGDPERAIAALDAAIALDEDAPTLRALAALLRERRHWQRAVDVLRRLIARVRPDEATALELEVAQVYLTGFSDPAAAREAALRALELEPMSAEAVALLLEHRLPSVPSEPALRALEASAEAARAALVDVGRAARGAEQLHAVAQLRQDHELVALSGQLRQFVAGQPVEPRPSLALAPRPVVQHARAVTRSPLVDSVLRELLVAIPETTRRLHPIDTSRMGKLAKPSSKQRAAELGGLDELARLVETAEYAVELGAGSTIGADDERVVLGRDLIPLLPRATGRFRVLRSLALFADGLGFLERIDDAALLALLAGCLEVAKVPWPASLAAVKPSAAVVEERARAVDKALARRERKALIALAPRLAELPDPRRFRAAVLSSAMRLATFVTGDLAAVTSELGAETSGELARLAVSAPFIEARRRWLTGEGA